MAEGSGIETYANHTNSVTGSANGEEVTASSGDGTLVKRIGLFVAIVLASAGLAYAIVRATLLRAPTDPTTERIQQLIDEANRLLAQLDEKKSDS